MDRKEYYTNYYQKHKEKKLKRANEYYQTNKEEINKNRKISHFYFAILPPQKISFA